MIKLLYFNPRKLPKRCDIQRGPLTGRVFAISINTHVNHYIEVICIVLKIKSKTAMSGDMANIIIDHESRFQNVRGFRERLLRLFHTFDGIAALNHLIEWQVPVINLQSQHS